MLSTFFYFRVKNQTNMLPSNDQIVSYDSLIASSIFDVDNDLCRVGEIAETALENKDVLCFFFNR